MMGDLRFYVSVENSVFVHVVDGLEHLVHVVLNSLLGKVMPAPFDCFIHIHVHEFEDQSQPSCWLVTD